MSMTGKALYQPWNDEEFMADYDVQAMKDTERWMYRSLLQASFFCSTRPYLPNDDAKLWRLAGCDSLLKWNRNKVQVLKKFEAISKDGQKLLFQKRVERDWERESKYRDKLSSAQRDRANKRWGKDKVEKMPTALPGHSHGIPENATELELNGTELNCTELNPASPENEESMNLKTRISDMARLHLTPISATDKAWPDIAALGRAYGQTEVASAFEDWAKQQLDPPTFPLTKFVQVADEMLKHQESVATPETNDLVCRLTAISNGEVIPNFKQVAIIKQWLTDGYTTEEVATAFKKFYEQIENDPFLIKFGGKDFSEKGLALMNHGRKLKLDRESEDRLIARQKVELANEAAARFAPPEWSDPVELTLTD